MPTNTPHQKEPWYKNPFMTIFVVGLPALVVVVCIFFIVWSIRIQDSTVRDDWYMDGKTLYQDATRDKLAHDLNISGVMRFDDKIDDNNVHFELRYPQDSIDTGTLKDGTPLQYPATLSVSISHATDSSRDKDFIITHMGDNVYQGKVAIDDTPAKYYLQVSNEGTHNWRLRQTQKLPAKNVVFVPLSSFDDSKQALPDQRKKRS